MSRSPTDPPSRARLDALALAFLQGVGPIRYRELIAEHGDASRALLAIANAEAAADAQRAAEHALLEATRARADVWVSGEDSFPDRLRELYAPPTHLFARGNPRMLVPPVVAIVGTRHPSAYGERVAAVLAAELARAGASVVSGLARGIDAIAHRAALDVGGRTAAVLGTGVDVAYPRESRELQGRIGRDGLLLSEYAPREGPSAGAFPRRNRIIAGLADLVILVEAGLKSGALITAAHATELNRTVAAVPGPIDAQQSRGTNELIRDGAHVITSPDDALSLLGMSTARVPAVALDGAEGTVWNALSEGALDLDALTACTGLTARECLTAVTGLELRGVVACGVAGEVRRVG